MKLLLVLVTLQNFLNPTSSLQIESFNVQKSFPSHEIIQLRNKIRSLIQSYQNKRDRPCNLIILDESIDSTIHFQNDPIFQTIHGTFQMFEDYENYLTQNRRNFVFDSGCTVILATNDQVYAYII